MTDLAAPARAARRLRAQGALHHPRLRRARARRGCGRGSGRSRAGRSRSPRPATSSSTRSATRPSSIVRAEPGALHAFYNTCLHRGRRLAEGCGSFADGAIRCPYHGWCYALDGRLVDVPDRDEFVGLPDDLALAPVRVDTWGGFVFVNLDPRRRAAARLPRPAARRCSRRTTSNRCACARRSARSSTRTGRRSSTRSTRATTCRACTRRSCRGPTT